MAIPINIRLHALHSLLTVLLLMSITLLILYSLSLGLAIRTVNAYYQLNTCDDLYAKTT